MVTHTALSDGKRSPGFCHKLWIRTSEIITICCLRSQRVELLGWRVGCGSGACQLSLANGVHDFNTHNCTPSRPKRFEAQPRPHLPFHCAVILLDDIVKIRALPDSDA